MKYARIQNNIAVEVIDFDPADRFHPDVAVLFEKVPDDVNQNATRDGQGIWAAYVAPPYVEPVMVPPTPVVAPTECLIDIGPFMDRFGSAKMPVLMSVEPTVKAILADMFARKWIDLKRADVPQAIGAIAAYVPAVTPALKTSILTAPVTSEENRALRTLFFS